MPVGEKRPKGARAQPTVPSLVPVPEQTAAEMRSSQPKALECRAETGSALEGDGFELPVPRTTPGSWPISTRTTRRD
jgi:hypothetical protein